MANMADPEHQRELERETDSGPKPRSATAKALRHAAHSYLQRYASSKENLRRVLRQRLDRAIYAYGPAQNGTPEDIEDILRECETLGLINDAEYAALMAKSWLIRGESVRAIQARLARKGVSSNMVDEALAAIKQSHPDVDLQAAIALVRRRRLGPMRLAEKREASLQKDLGVLARAGFTYPLARKVLDAKDDAALYDLIEESQSR